jgi:hypothetical protein
MDRETFLKAAIALPLAAVIDRSLAGFRTTPTASAVDVVPVAGCISEALRDKRCRPFADGGTVTEMNKGDVALMWGSRFWVQGEEYNGITIVRANDEIGSFDSIDNFDGLKYRGSADLQMIWLPRNIDDLTVKNRMASKANLLMIPQGSARLVNGVIIELSQVDFRSPIRTFVNKPFYWSRN